MRYRFYHVEWVDDKKFKHDHFVNTLSEALNLRTEAERKGFEPKSELVYLDQSAKVTTKKGLIDIFPAFSG